MKLIPCREKKSGLRCLELGIRGPQEFEKITTLFMASPLRPRLIVAFRWRVIHLSLAGAAVGVARINFDRELEEVFSKMYGRGKFRIVLKDTKYTVYSNGYNSIQGELFPV